MNNGFIRVIIIIAILFIASGSIFIVDQRQQAIVTQFGEAVRVEKNPGMHFKIPFIQRVLFFDKRILDITVSEREVLAKDQKRIIVNAYAKYKISDPLKYFQSVKTTYQAETRLITDLESSLRQVIGEEPLVALLTNERSVMMNKIESILDQKARKAGMEIVDVRISRADLPRENSTAIYSRMQTDREKEAKEFRAQGSEEASRIKSEADRESKAILSDANKNAAISRGEGDKEANRILIEAISKDPELYSFLKSLESYKKSLQNKNTTLIITPNSEYFKYLNHKHK